MRNPRSWSFMQQPASESFQKNVLEGPRELDNAWPGNAKQDLLVYQSSKFTVEVGAVVLGPGAPSPETPASAVAEVVAEPANILQVSANKVKRSMTPACCLPRHKQMSPG